MAQKKITDLQLKSSVVGDESLPVDNGIQSYRVTPSQMYDYVRSRIPSESYELGNLAITTAVGSSALTIALKTKAGTDATSTDPIRVGFRSATLTTGNFVLREITGALSVVVSSGSTLGQVDAQASRIWVYLIDNAGTPELAVSHALYTEDALVSTTAEGGAGAADSATAIYSTTSRSSVALRCVGYIDNTQTTAGTWASAGTKIQLLPEKVVKGPTVTRITSGTSTYYTPAGCTRIKVTAAGGGGGGGGTGAGAATGGNGGSTTFGSSLLTAAGGSGTAATGGAGGAPTVNSPAISIIQLSGGNGLGGGAGQFVAGGQGGNNPFGGAGQGNYSGGGVNGLAGATNSGAGGSSATAGTGGGNGGGGAGAYLEAWIINPLASYAYAVGAAGTAGAGANTGGAGGSGVIIVEEFYD